TGVEHAARARDEDMVQVGIRARAAEAREVLRGRRDPRALEAVNECGPELRVERPVVAVGARPEEVARRPGRVDNGSEIDVDAEPAQVAACRFAFGARLRRAAGAAELGRRAVGRAGREPLDGTAFLVGGDE